ncbi:MAG: hypothetical protein ABI442_16790 [Gemmatimonadaceae bacterium]
MRTLLRILWILAALLTASLMTASPLFAQRERPGMEITIASAPLDEGPTVTTTNLLADPNTRELLRNGFPTRVHFRLELWKKGRWFFDDFTGRTQWDVGVHFDPTTGLFNVLRQQDSNIENFVGFATLTSAEEEFDRPFRTLLRPKRGGRYYYNLVVDVQTLTETDLDALNQWLRGPTAPGRSNPITAIRSGLGTLFSRILGGDKRHYEVRSELFSVP